MKIAAAYIRVSTEDQTEYSPDSQIKIIRNYAEKNDMIVPDEFVFIDEGISGRKAEKRPAFMHMIGTAKKKPKPFDVILVYALSRFARNREDSVVYKRMLRKDLGIDLISTSQDFGNDKTSVLIESLLEAMDEYYSIDLGENVKRGMTEKASRGEPLAAPAFGYLIENKSYYINPDTAPIVKMIFDDFIGGMGYRDITLKLNAMGIRTKRGNLWENRTVEYILHNPVYIGKIRWNPVGRTHRNYDDPNIMIVDSSHEPVIDNRTWEQAQKRAEQIKEMYPKYHPMLLSSSGYILQGIVKCSNCGAALNRIGIAALQCGGYSHGKCKVSHYITIDKLNAMVLMQLESDLKSSTIELTPRTTMKAEYKTEVFEKQINREKRKLIRIKEAYENGIDSLAEYQRNKTKIMEEIARLNEEVPLKELTEKDKIKKFQAVHKDVMKVLKDDNASVLDKNEILRTFIEKIVFDRVNCRIQIFYYL